MKNPTSRWWAIASSMLAFGGLAMATSGCGEESAETDTTASGGGTSPTGGTPTGPGTGGGDAGTGGSTPDGCDPGEVRACEVPVGTQNGVLTCIAGQEACRSNGTWGPCEGAIFARSAKGLPDGLRGDELRDPVVVAEWLAAQPLASSLTSITPRFPGDDGAVHRAESDSEPCASPCDPACQAFPNPLDPEVPDSEVDPTPSGATLLEFIEAVAGGLLDKLFPDDDCDSASDCNVDSNCGDDDDASNESDEDTGDCDAWGEGEFDDDAGGVDFTVGAGCGPTGSQQVPVCNRGSAAYAGNLTAWIWPANAPEIATCTIDSNKSPQHECTFAADLDPGECMVMPSSCWSGVTGNNKAIQINPTRSAPNTVTPVAEAASKTCNNWGFWDKDVPCSSCTDSWETDLDDDDDDGSFCGIYFDMDVDVIADERMLSLEYRPTSGSSWEPITWVWNDRWDSNSYEEDGCSGGAQAMLYDHNFGGDYHYHVRLCDDLCDEAQDASNPGVRFTYDCPRTFEDELVGDVVYQGICPEATRVQWGYLGFNGVTPGNSRIELEGRTGTTDPPTDGTYIDLATARDNYSGSEYSPACLLTDPDSECPIDLYAAFDGAPDAIQEFLQIRYTLKSSGDNKVAPRLYELYATFTCPDSE